MAKTCSKCGKNLGLFEVSEKTEEGELICRVCQEQIKVEQEQQAEKDEKEKLMQILSRNAQWEYKIVNLKVADSEESGRILAPENEEGLNNLGKEGWELVSKVGINNTKKEGEISKTATEQISLIFKRKV